MAKTIYQKYRPKLIVVSGSAGKSLTIALLKQLLSKKHKIYWTQYHQNHRLGLSLTFLLESQYQPLKLALKALKLLVVKVDYPEYIILEFGFEQPNLVDVWLKKLHIDYLIITALGQIPAFTEVFAGPEEIQLRKKALLAEMTEDGLIILNGDDYTQVELAETARSRVLYFGFTADSNFRIENTQVICDFRSATQICGTSFTLITPQGQRPVFLRNLFGKGVIYAYAATAALAQNLGFTLEEIGLSLENFQGLPHRLNLIRSRHGYWILDNTYHLSEASIWESLDILQKLPAKRKIFVLSDVLNIGKYAFEVHEKIGRVASKFVDHLIAFGVKSRFSLASAIEEGFCAESAKHFFQTEHHNLLHYLESVLQPDDLVLIVGDKKLKLYEIVESLK